MRLALVALTQLSAVLLAVFCRQPELLVIPLCSTYLIVSLVSSPTQRHRPWLPPPAPGLTGAAVLRGAAAPGDSLPLHAVRGHGGR